MKFQNGFSLFEVMITIGIIGVLGVITTSIFTQTLSTSSQTEDLSNLKQNGETAMNVLTETVRNAQAVVCYGPPNDSYPPPDNQRKWWIVIRTIEGTYTRLRFIDPVVTAGGITSNGYIIKQNGLNPAELSTFCAMVPGSDNTPVVFLTNTNLASGVSISDGRFQRLAGSGGKDTINIRFNVNRSKSVFSGAGSESVTVTTTVQIR